MCDPDGGGLDWVWDTTCDVEPQRVYYEGHHVLFGVEQPPESVQLVTVTPDPGVEVSLWGYWQGVGNFRVPPGVTNTSVGDCSVSHPTNALERPTNPGEPESLVFTAPSRNGYNNLFGVVGFGPDGTAGGFTVKVEEYRSAEDTCTADDFDAVTNLNRWTGDTQVIALEDGFAEWSDDLQAGEPQCTLDWMGSAFCAPETQYHYFGGNHVLYALEEPLAPGEQVDIEVLPASDVEVSLYGYTTSDAVYSSPPLVPSTTCEASHRLDIQHRPGYGEVERIRFQNPLGNPNSYHVVFGVAGYTAFWPPRADDPMIGAEGPFVVRVSKSEPPPPHCGASLPGSCYDLWPGNVALVSLDDQGQARVSGDLAEGACTHLEFAQELFCFPATQNDDFEGNHLFFALDEPQPPNSIVDITVTPAPGVQLNLYGYQLGADRVGIPPLPCGGISCEAANTASPGQPETLTFQNPTGNAYNLFFAVAGPAEVLEGAFTVDVQMRVSEPHCEESLERAQSEGDWPSDVRVVELDANSEAVVTGDLAEGACTNLEFAEQGFCFPATQNQHFEGNHVFFALDQPQPPGSVLEIKVVPDPDVEVSLLGWHTGTSDFTVPPAINTSVCEASYTRNGIAHEPNPGQPETIRFTNPNSDPNARSVFFSVAGDRWSGTAGRFTVYISLIQGQTHCEASLERAPNTCPWPSDVHLIEVDGNGLGLASGDLAEGACTNLAWASTSGNACFPATDNFHFEGNHLFFALSEPLPPRSIARIEAIPADDVDISLYGTTAGTTNCLVPPNINATTCEASYARGIGDVSDPGQPEAILFQNPGNSEANVFLGVAGTALMGDRGTFDLRVEITTDDVHCEESLPGQSTSAWPDEVRVIPMDGNTGSIEANLTDGRCTNLAWASTSSNACFPATESASYEGPHLFFTLPEALPSDKRLNITATPNGSRNDLALYSYLIGTDAYFVPPYVPGVATCEAAQQAAAGEAETLTLRNAAGNGHNVLIGVTGLGHMGPGTFTLQVEMVDP
ncbi:MAG: hypothetical protein AAFX99_03440 [Myxococcota bacterium]